MTDTELLELTDCAAQLYCADPRGYLTMAATAVAVRALQAQGPADPRERLAHSRVGEWLSREIELAPLALAAAIRTELRDHGHAAYLERDTPVPEG